MRKPLAWLGGEIKTPPFSPEERIEAGTLLRRLQEGETLGMPESRPMPDVGAGCLELRVGAWRVVCAIRSEAVVILDVFRKTTQRTPKAVLRRGAARLERFGG